MHKYIPARARQRRVVFEYLFATTSGHTYTQNYRVVRQNKRMNAVVLSSVGASNISTGHGRRLESGNFLQRRKYGFKDSVLRMSRGARVATASNREPLFHERESTRLGQLQ